MALELERGHVLVGAGVVLDRPNRVGGTMAGAAGHVAMLVQALAVQGQVIALVHPLHVPVHIVGRDLGAVDREPGVLRQERGRGRVGGIIGDGPHVHVANAGMAGTAVRLVEVVHPVDRLKLAVLVQAAGIDQLALVVVGLAALRPLGEHVAHRQHVAVAVAALHARAVHRAVVALLAGAHMAAQAVLLHRHLMKACGTLP
jgi:hypothetical protein